LGHEKTIGKYLKHFIIIKTKDVRMDQTTKTMIENLYKNTGKSLEQWIEIVKAGNFEKHGAIVKFLKEQHTLTHGFANLIALKSKGTDAGSAENTDDLIVKQYQGKEHLKAIYDLLINEIQKFGNDVEISPKNAYVSIRRKKQFTTLTPATKTRFEVGINLKGQSPEGKLEAITTANAMCSHKINLSGLNDIDQEVINWLKMAYENAK
jgi:predicted transport protein